MRQPIVERVIAEQLKQLRTLRAELDRGGPTTPHGRDFAREVLARIRSLRASTDHVEVLAEITILEQMLASHVEN